MRYECKAVVIGGGITGLCAAHYLGEFFGRASVLLVESSELPGGTARTDRVDGFLMDWGPNGFLDREPLTLKWIDELGESDALVRANQSAARRFIFRNNKLIQIKKPPAFFFSPLLSLSGRLRLLREPFISPKQDDEWESIHAFASRRIGQEAADVLVSCMVSGIYGGDAKALSLADCFPRLKAIEQEHGSLIRGMLAKRRDSSSGGPTGPGGTLTSFRGGMGYLPERACATLGDRALLGDAATRVTKSNGSYFVDTANGHTIEADYVVMALPAYHAANVIAELDGAVAHSLQAIPYAGIAVICTAYSREQVDHSLDGFGYLVPRSEGQRILGSLWTSSIFPHEAPAGQVLFRTMIGGATDPEALMLTDAELLDVVGKEVHPVLRISGEPTLHRVYRHARGIPQYTQGHGRRLAELDSAESRHPRIVFAGNAYRGIGLNDCIVSAVRAVERVVAEDENRHSG